MYYRLPSFNYYKPKSLREALHTISELDDYKILAGGTDLINDMRIKRYLPKNIVDISAISELKYIIDEGSRVRIGALTTLQEIAESDVVRKKLPLLAETVENMASWQIRNIATIGGNLCNASPAADSPLPLLVYEATLVLVSKDGKREVPIEKFFLGPRKTVLRKGEILYEIVVPCYDGVGTSFIKLGRRNAFTLSVVGVATMVKVSNGVFEDVRIALNSVAPTPIRAHSVEEFLKGKKVSIDVINEGAKHVRKDISPISDVRASAEYRADMAVVITRDSLIKSLSMLGISLGGD